MNDAVLVSKNDEAETAVPQIWRDTLEQVVVAFSAGDFRLEADNPHVREIDSKDAARMRANVHDYGATLVPLPKSVWKTSVSQWMRGYWSVLVDLYTAEEGESDLVLHVHVYEGAGTYAFDIQSLHVP